MERGIDEVRTYFAALHDESVPDKGGRQRQGDDGFTTAATGSGYD